MKFDDLPYVPTEGDKELIADLSSMSPLEVNKEQEVKAFITQQNIFVFPMVSSCNNIFSYNQSHLFHLLSYQLTANLMTNHTYQQKVIKN